MVAGYKYLTRRNINCDICGHTPKYHSKYGVNCGKIGKKIFVNKTKAADTQLKKKEDWITALTSVVVNEVKQGNEKTVVLTLRENIHSTVEEAKKETFNEILGILPTFNEVGGRTARKYRRQIEELKKLSHKKETKK